MLERLEKPLRIVCLVLSAMVLLQVARFASKKNPLDQLTIPELPTLATNELTQADAKATNSISVITPEKKQTNAVAGQKETNAVAPASVELKNTNAVAESSKGQTNATVKTPGTDSNVIAQAASIAPNSNLVMQAISTGTNSNALAQAASVGTNSVATNIVALNTNKASVPPAMPPGGMMPGGRPPTAKKASNLPPGIQARVDKITESELLAPVVRPAPMALFGIAGDSAFLRGPSGQTGVIKEGEEIGGIKLLKIGFNRVLVEQDGEKKELMVFSGFGGESLLPKEK